MGNIHSNIKPTGLIKKDLVDALYMIVKAIETLCTKLDADGTAATTTHLALCYTAIFNVVIEDSKGNRVGQGIAETSTIEPTHIISPGNVTDTALNALMYQIVLSLETLSEQLDTDALTLNTYESVGYTPIMTQRIENSKGNLVGAGTDFTFKPGGMFQQKQLVDFLYNCFFSIYTLTYAGTTVGCDSDGTLTDVDYCDLCYTAICTLMIENSKGSQIGVSR